MTITNDQTLRNFVIENRLIFHEDGGHGWLQVPKLTLMKIPEFNISGYSYEDKNYVYLEEDCDLTNFMNAIGIHYTSPLNKVFFENIGREYANYSPIRSKQHYTPTTKNQQHEKANV